MRDRERIFELRKNLIDDWKYRGLEWRERCYKYRVSKRWFYKLRIKFMLKGHNFRGFCLPAGISGIISLIK